MHAELKQFWIAPISYKEKVIKVDDLNWDPNPMVKEPKFAFENEVRIIWFSKSARCDPILTKPNIQLSKLITRIQ